ncbi:hypothetical protein DFH11DRAFT_1118345 [Phellopilus nigrolimitatus]|nr:hypothetical protein DFH11DRAFT_1118345 [Phellopilus nigrolimitatus]
MDRLPPSLLYLVIYNPALSAPETARPDDEDAEEQAHVLFYTANDHAVSKDRVLRQVGLAKALVNFTTIFDPHSICDSVHSQSRRMVMLSPEPNFWIHACFELEKTSRISKKDEKSKGKQKETVYDYNEASLHDAALRIRLRLGYEAFKVLHGSFTSILCKLGKEALELQLERFFTVWSWSWDLGKQVPFADYLGIRVHPLSNQLMSLIDMLEDRMPPHYSPLILVSPCVVVSRTSPLLHSPSLIRHLQSILENRPSTSQGITDESSAEELKAPAAATSSNSDTNRVKNGATNKKFLGVPGLNMNINVDMDVRKWSWPGVLTFGKGGNPSKPKVQENSSSENDKAQNPVEDAPTLEAGEENSQAKSAKEEAARDLQKTPKPKVDSQALEDALSSDASSLAGSISSEHASEAAGMDCIADPRVAFANVSSRPESITTHPESIFDGKNTDPLLGNGMSDAQRPECNIEAQLPGSQHGDGSLESSQSKPPISFSQTFVHLLDSNPLDTRRVLIRYIRNENLLLALVPSLDKDDILDDEIWQDLLERCTELVERLKETVETEQEKIAAAFSSSPVQNVLQKSQHVIAAPNELTYSSATFSATSWHLHEGQRVLELDQESLEIFSRGQSPQDWHLVKRGLGICGDVYMEIGRKEASLVDVDNEITAVFRRFVE